MSIRTVPALTLLGLPLMLAAPVAHAGQGNDNCAGFVDSLPAVITTQGTWCLRADLTTAVTTARVIEIKASNVTLDCNDHIITHTDPGNTSMGISFNGTTRNVTVRRCDVRDFWNGIYLNGPGSVVEDNRVSGSGSTAITVIGDSTYSGLPVATAVRRNVVRNVGGKAGTSGQQAAIETFYANDITDNLVDGVIPNLTPQGNAQALGIVMSYPVGAVVSGNRIRRLMSQGSWDLSYGIHAFGGTTLIRDNIVTGEQGSPNRYGIYCQGGTHVTQRNVLSGWLYTVNTTTYNNALSTECKSTPVAGYLNIAT
jgi:hypothetical protein